ncbi:MAG TPA: hypothetical protein VMD99_11290 [Terriglobales bacterium]|nr:hypothetical protein [Terriglobales bacterium]
MPSEARSRQSSILSHSKKNAPQIKPKTKPKTKIKKSLDRMGTFLLILALAVSSIIVVCWLIGTVVSAADFR